MATRLVTVHIAYDSEARVWFIESSDLPGLSGEAPTSDALIQRIPEMIVDLVEANGFDDGAEVDEVPIEIIASARARPHHAE
jgi:hypothetical protein